MKKRLFLLTLVIAMVVVFTGCGGAGDSTELSAKELLKKGIDNAYNINTAEGDLKMALAIDLGETPDPQMEMLASMLQDVSLDLHSVYDMSTDAIKAAISGNLNASGMSYAFEMYMDEEKMAMKIPMMPKYLVQNLITEDGEKVVMDKTQAHELNKKVMDIMLEQISDDQISKQKDVEVTINGEAVKVTTVKVTFDDAQAKDFVKKAVKAVANDESLRDMIATQAVNQAKSFGDDMTKEEALADMDASLETMDADWDEAAKAFTINSLEMVSGLDANDQIISGNVVLDMNVSNPETPDASPVNVKITADTSMYNVNGTVDIAFPELTPENSQDMNDMSGFGM